jgi:hypothetical protein
LILKALEKSLLNSPKDIKMILEHLPSDLESTYANFLCDIPIQHRVDAIKLLNLVLGSSQPLKLDELNIAFTITTDYTSERTVWSNRQLKMAHSVQGILGQLVRISESGVSLVHQSAKDFLLNPTSRLNDPLSKDFNFSSTTASRALASSCIYYLLLEELAVDLFSSEASLHESVSEASDESETLDIGLFLEHDPLSLEDDTIFKDTRVLDRQTCQILSERHRFFNYAAFNWFEHYSSAEDEAPSQLRQAVLQLLDPREGCCTNWLRYYLVKSHLDLSVLEQLDTILLAAYLDLPGILTEHLAADEAYSQHGKDRALFWAALRGSSRAVRELLAVNAYPNASYLDGQTAIVVAAQNGHVDCVKLLLADARTDINACGLSGRTALSLAYAYGHFEVFEALWNRMDCQRNSIDKTKSTPLFWAVGGGHRNIMTRTLKGPDVNVNHQDKTGRSAISWAAGDEVEVSIKLLLRNSRVDPNLKTEEANLHCYGQRLKVKLMHWRFFCRRPVGIVMKLLCSYCSNMNTLVSTTLTATARVH